MNKLLLILLGLGCFVGASVAVAQDAGSTGQDWTAYLSKVHIKPSVAAKLTAAQLEAKREKAAKRIAARIARGPLPNTPGATCAAATNDVSALPYTHAGNAITDSVNLTNTWDMTYNTSAACVGGALVGDDPRGSVFQGTGVGGDEAYRIRTSANCSLTIGMTPGVGGNDQNVAVYSDSNCNGVGNLICIDDSNGGGAAESVALSAIAGTNYFVVVDGYLSSSSSGSPPTGPYTLNITGTGCTLTPVDLQSFEIK
jgi:hypothetical protein